MGTAMDLTVIPLGFKFIGSDPAHVNKRNPEPISNNRRFAGITTNLFHAPMLVKHSKIFFTS